MSGSEANNLRMPAAACTLPVPFPAGWKLEEAHDGRQLHDEGGS